MSGGEISAYPVTDLITTLLYQQLTPVINNLFSNLIVMVYDIVRYISQVICRFLSHFVLRLRPFSREWQHIVVCFRGLWWIQNREVDQLQKNSFPHFVIYLFVCVRLPLCLYVHVRSCVRTCVRVCIFVYACFLFLFS